MIKALLKYLYSNWAYICLPLALYTTVILLSSSSVLSGVILLIWLQFPVYLMHQFEEHVYPGNFKEYANKQITKTQHSDIPFNERNIFWINIIAIWVLFPLCAVLAQNYALKIGALPVYLSLFNATLHILDSITTRAYTPGLIVSIFLNYPFGIYALYLMNKEHVLSLKTNIYAFLAALLIHIVIIVYIRHCYRCHRNLDLSSNKLR